MGDYSNDDAFLTITVICYAMFVIIIATLMYLLCCQEEKRRRLAAREQAVPVYREQIIQNPVYDGVRERPLSPAAYGL
jgi:hypothetical protein